MKLPVFKIDEREQDGGVVLALSGELDLAGAPELTTALNRAQAGGPDADRGPDRPGVHRLLRPRRARALQQRRDGGGLHVHRHRRPAAGAPRLRALRAWTRRCRSRLRPPVRSQPRVTRGPPRRRIRTRGPGRCAAWTRTRAGSATRTPGAARRVAGRRRVRAAPAGRRPATAAPAWARDAAFGKCGGHGASPSPPSSSRRARSSSASSDPGTSSIVAAGSPTDASRAGTVSSRRSPGSTSATSDHSSAHDTRASGVGRTLYPDATVRSRAFWL